MKKTYFGKKKTYVNSPYIATILIFIISTVRIGIYVYWLDNYTTISIAFIIFCS